MTWTSRCLTATGLLLLAHACYSAHEHGTLSLTSSIFAHSSKGQLPGTKIPMDICVETVVATIVLCFGLVLGSQKLRPIEWHVWAGKIEREGVAGFLDDSGKVDKEYRGSPFAALESRPGFVNIRQQRREYTQRSQKVSSR
ncbi:hypothetical protein CP533_2373 [Ophiocordyceps camponoti-saundersi (nom. inval.)]|nr:hypothetical protein CP533_2373 [Ophiocordyceps camponoti-saundersi (nom. inval.)]